MQELNQKSQSYNNNFSSDSQRSGISIPSLKAVSSIQKNNSSSDKHKNSESNK